ncbi:MAG TPA: DUF2845 domain-containing protein [Pseudomonas sp.]|uniref:DUF2845 domain-containing protein n=1 Tax=Pseudomonas sp. TaxID=306 RepID=UPI002EDA82E5
MKIMRWCFATFFITIFLFSASSAQASMRCDKGIISGGETIAEVLRKCGQPDDRDVIQPAVDSSGKPAYQSVTVENWVYGPEMGCTSI